ncbi:condensation domain-containing protein, partial [Rhodococcus oryzae]|uniref:condensation domain-containing protein n=1 Tax=Rhodococcus oryzae TaxID=2571143 RepID=UPI003721600F
RAPVTEVERVVASVFGELLGLERVGLDDDFFALGGNSLVAMQAAARLGSALDARVAVRELFEASTVEALAARLASSVGAGGHVALAVRERPERIPLSPAQSRMWFLNRFDASSSAYNIPVAVRLSGALDVAALQASVADVVARHEVLRTVYVDIDGIGHQVVLPADQAVIDLMPVLVDAESVAGAAMEFVSAPFDVTEQVPLRARLYEVEAGAEYVLAMVVHHISADGWSVAPLTRDVMVAYAARSVGQEPSWAPLPVQYVDYTLWQREVLGSEQDPQSLVSAQLDYWTAALRGVPDVLELPTDRPRPAVMSNLGALQEFTIDAELHAALDAVARASGATLFMVMHAAVAVLLSRLSGTSDIVIGTPVAGRGDAALDDLVGMFVNTLVLRTEVDGGASFGEIVARARETDLGAFGHADVPFEQVVEVLNPVRSQAYSPLFQVSLSFQNLDTPEVELGELKAAAVDSDVVLAKFDLDFGFADSYDAAGAPAGVTGVLTYATALFDAAGVARVTDGLVRILRAVTTDIESPVGDIDLLGAGERELVLREWNATDAPVPVGTLDSLFADQVVRTPGAVAMVDDSMALTYRQFNARVDAVARHLIGLGVGVESRVVLAMRRSIDQVVAM